jgi:hypothetical protein
MIRAEDRHAEKKVTARAITVLPPPSRGSMQRRHQPVLRAILFLYAYEFTKPPTYKYSDGIISLRLKPVVKPLQHRVGLYRFFEPVMTLSAAAASGSYLLECPSKQVPR